MKTKLKTQIKTKIKTQMKPVSFLTTLLLISIGVNVNANNTANHAVNNTANNTVNSHMVNTKTNTTKAHLTAFDQQPPKTALKMSHLGLTQEEIVLSENLKAIALEMDKNNSLSSLEILGIFATTKADKIKYARKFVRAIRNYTNKVLAFQKYLNQAHTDIAGADSMFDYVPIKAQQTNLSPTNTQQKRITRAINLGDCDKQCERDITTLVQTPLIAPVDLYFKNNTQRASNTQIQQWALKIGIRVDAVESGFITLNHSD